MAILKLIRYKNLLMVLLTMVLTKYALIKVFFDNSYLSVFQFFILVCSVLSITASGYIINDIFDINADKINKPQKLFIEVLVTKKKAWIFYFLGILFGFITGVYISLTTQLPYYSFYFIGTIGILFLYSKYLKKIALIGNLTIAVLCTLVIYLVVEFEGAYFIKNSSLVSLKIIFVAYYIFSFLTTLIREIIKDIEDINGDIKLNAHTLPILIGRKRASKVAFFFAAVLLFGLLLILQLLHKEIIFVTYSVIFIVLPLVYFMYVLWKIESKREYSKLSKLLKIIMFFGIISMILFNFIDLKNI